MSETSPMEPVAEVFETQRDRLRAVAYRMLGSHADAEDVVQDAWLRLARQDTATIDNLAGWLTTVVGRISLDVLRSRQAHPEASYDDRLSDLVVTVDDGPAPEDDVALADSVGLALLAVLESLGPSERLAFVLHDLFAVPFDEIGKILGKSTGAAKMLASRARRKVQATERPTATNTRPMRIAGILFPVSVAMPFGTKTPVRWADRNPARPRISGPSSRHALLSQSLLRRASRIALRWRRRFNCAALRSWV